MSNKNDRVLRTFTDHITAYSFEDLRKKMKDFENKYSDGKDFVVSADLVLEYDSEWAYIELQCSSPETEEEYQSRKSIEKSRKKAQQEEEKRQYLILKKKFEQ